MSAPLNLVRALLLLAAVAAHGPDVMGKADDWLAIDFSTAGGLKPVTFKDTTYVCIKLMLRPEDGGSAKEKWEVTARVQFPTTLPDKIKKAERSCAAAGGNMVNLAKLQDFINGAASGEDTPVEACNSTDDGPTKPDSELFKAVTQWNDRFFNMDTAVTRQNADRFHGKGLEHKHLAQEVTHFVMPAEVQERINERLTVHRKALFGDEGAGQGGTTGAFFLAGNVGFGNTNQGANLMDLVFPPPKNKSSSVDPKLFINHEAGFRLGGTLYGEAPLGGDHEKPTEAMRPPDLAAHEDEIKRLLLKRSDVQYLFGDEIEMQWQHRLWRYGPNFDPKSKGGIWHKDTCPFGINGALPENSIMFTIVYILYTENLDGPTAGTRVKDDDGTSISLPCVAGEGNVIRSGESDNDAFFHSGPLNIQKLDGSRPAYRVMLQSKALVRPVDGRKRAIPSKGNWRGLGIEPLVFEEGAKPDEKLKVLQSWLHETSEQLTKGVGESNAVGFEAYPVNVGRAWAVASDLCAFLGLQTTGFPEPASPATPVVVFGWDQKYTESIKDTLVSSSFRVLNVASDGDFAELRRTHQETYSNLETADIDNAEKVSRILSSYPYDLHIVLDVPPIGERAIAEPILKRYGKLFESLAAKPVGEGRLSTLTLLSQQMPFSGRMSGGLLSVEKAVFGHTKEGNSTLTGVQKAFLEMEKEVIHFGESNNVRIVIMRVADRVYAPDSSALTRVAKGKKTNPCRVEECTDEEPLTRIHSEDLSLILRRMLAMFDMVATHGKDSSMKGTAAMESSIARFPSGTVLEVVDDGRPDSMLKADLWASVTMGLSDICEAGASCGNITAADSPGVSVHRRAKDRNADLKDALGMPKLRYPTYHHGAAKMFGAGEI